MRLRWLWETGGTRSLPKQPHLLGIRFQEYAKQSKASAPPRKHLVLLSFQCGFN